LPKKLDDAGIHVTRRTVSEKKYREDMRIPSTPPSAGEKELSGTAREAAEKRNDPRQTRHPHRTFRFRKKYGTACLRRHGLFYCVDNLPVELIPIFLRSYTRRVKETFAAPRPCWWNARVGAAQLEKIATVAETI